MQPEVLQGMESTYLYVEDSFGDDVLTPAQYEAMQNDQANVLRWKKFVARFEKKQRDTEAYFLKKNPLTDKVLVEC